MALTATTFGPLPTWDVSVDCVLTSSVSWQLSNAPWRRRSSFAAVVDATGPSIMGGSTETGPVNDVWHFSGASESNSRDYLAWSLTCSAVRWSPRNVAAVAVTGNRAVMYGGSGVFASVFFSDIWASVAPYR